MTGSPLLVAEGLRLRYSARGGKRNGAGVAALDDVGLSVARGEVLGVVGESGAGKSTLARTLLALERPDAGQVVFDGHEISSLPESMVRPLRRRFQPVFQDSASAFDPLRSVGASIAEPLDALAIGDRESRRRRVGETLDLVGLRRETARRRPGTLSGGERQRAAMARALAPAPELLVLDEPVSSLDLPVAVSILDLIAELRCDFGLTIVFVSHDLAMTRRLCDRVLVMRRGKIVDQGPADAVLGAPRHRYTRSLVEAAPTLARNARG